MSGNTLADFITVFFIAAPIVMVFIFVIGIFKMIVDKADRNYAINNLYNYDEIEIGMDEEEMLSIMGDDYNVSSLKDNRYKYVWRVNAVSKPGFGYTREYSGVKKVVIYVKDGVVEEIKPFNV